MPSSLCFLRASTHGVRTLFSVKARKTPSVERVADAENCRRVGAQTEVDWPSFARAKSRRRGDLEAIWRARCDIRLDEVLLDAKWLQVVLEGVCSRYIQLHHI